jgi:hypothetical protein
MIRLKKLRSFCSGRPRLLWPPVDPEPGGDVLAPGAEGTDLLQSKQGHYQPEDCSRQQCPLGHRQVGVGPCSKRLVTGQLSTALGSG